MGIQDVLYTIATAPIHAAWKTSSVTTSYARDITKAATTYLGLMKPNLPEPEPLWQLAATSGPYVKLAAISAALAVVIGAIGLEHYCERKMTGDEHHIFKVANQHHFIHSLALLAAPLCRSPFWVATMLLSGMIMFCGDCYYTAFTKNWIFYDFKMLGEICLVIAWSLMLL